MTVTNQDLTTALANLGEHAPGRAWAFDTLARYLMDPHVMQLHARSHSRASVTDVEDVTASLLASWWEKRASGLTVTSSAKAYLARVVHRRLLDMFEKRARKSVDVLVEDFGALTARHEVEYPTSPADAHEGDLLADMPTLQGLLRSRSVDDLLANFVVTRVLPLQRPCTRARDARALRDQLDLTLGRTTYATLATRVAGVSATPEALQRAVNATHTRTSRMRARLRVTLAAEDLGGWLGLTQVEVSFLRAWLERVLGV